MNHFRYQRAGNGYNVRQPPIGAGRNYPIGYVTATPDGRFRCTLISMRSGEFGEGATRDVAVLAAFGIIGVQSSTRHRDLLERALDQIRADRS